MDECVATTIENWFAAHAADSDFERPPETFPYSVITPKEGKCGVIYGTKPQILSAAFHLNAAVRHVGMVGRCGLPRSNDVKWISRFVGHRRLVFLGDMDPVDLLVFAWLRTQFHPHHIDYLGVSDFFLGMNGVNEVSSLLLPCSSVELLSIPFIKSVFPNYPDVVGENCANILLSGHKIELDAVVSCKKAGIKSLVLPMV